MKKSYICHSASGAEGSIRRRQSQLSSDRAAEEFYKINVSVGGTRPRSVLQLTDNQNPF